MALPRGGANNRLLSVLGIRFRRWQDADFEALWKEVAHRQQKTSARPKTTTTDVLTKENDPPPSVVRQVVAAIAEGAYSKGVSL